MPRIKRVTSSIEDDESLPRTGPKIPAGLMVVSSRRPPSAAMKSQAARSAMAFDRTYALISPSVFVQLVSSNGAVCGG